MSINNNNAFHRLQADLSNWQELGKVKKSDKVKIEGYNSVTGSGNITISRGGALQNAGRSLSKIFQQTLADGESTNKWIQSLQEKTFHNISDIQKSINNLDSNNLKELETAMDSLTEIRHVIQQSTVGLNNLRSTYENERSGDDDLKNEFQNTSFKNTALIIDLDEQINALQEKINSIQNKFVKASIDVTITSSKDRADPESLAQASLSLTQDLAQKAMTNRTTFKSYFKEYSIPSQFYIDAPRSRINLNNETLIDNKIPGSNTIKGVYSTLLQAVDNSESAAAVIMALTCQTIFAPTQIHLMLASEGKFNYRQDGETIQYNIKIEEGKVHLMSEIVYNLHDMEKPEDDPLGYQFVKKEIILSLDELKTLNSNPNQQLQNIEVKDTYSPIVDHSGIAKMFLQQTP